MNGATEATLQELLQLAQQQLKAQQDLKKFFEEWKRLGGMNIGGSGGSSGGGIAGAAGTALSGITKASGPVGLAFGALSMAGKILSGAFDVMASIVGKVAEGLGKTVGNLLEFSFQAMQGSTSISKFVDAFRDLPFFIGSLAGIISKVIGYEEQLLETYRDLTKYGASFSGNLFEMSRMARQGYMTLEEFGAVLKNNSEIFTTAIGGADAGLRTFTEAQKKLMDPNGPYGKGILGLGIQAGEAGDMIAYFMKLQGNMSRQDRQSTDEMAKSTSALLVQLDAMAKLTGQNREQLEKEMKDQAFSKGVQTWVNSLKPDDQKKALLQLTTAFSQGGAGLRDEVAVRLMTNGKIRHAGTEAANNIYVATRGYSDASADSIVSMKNFAIGSKEMTIAQVNSGRQLATGYDSLTKVVGGPGMMGVLQLTGAMGENAKLVETTNRYLHDSLTAEQRAMEIEREQAKQAEGNASGLAAMQLKIRQFGNAIGEILITFLEPFGEAINKTTAWLLDWGLDIAKMGAKTLKPLIDKYLPEFMGAVGRMVLWFNDTWKYLTDSSNGTEFWKRLGEKVTDGFREVWKVVQPAFEVIWKEVKPLIVDAFKGLFSLIWDVLVDMIKPDFLKDKTSASTKSNTATLKNDPAVWQQAYEKLVSEGKINSKTDPATADKLVAEAAGKLSEKMDKFRSAVGNAQDAEDAARGAQPVSKATGSWGTTGRLIENFGTGTPAILHGSEGVITSDQLNQIMSYAMKSGGENKSATSLDRLNMQIAQLITINKEQAEYIRKNFEATKGLNGNLFS